MNNDFDILRWITLISYTFDDYTTLYNYINDDIAHETHIQKYKKHFEEFHQNLGIKFDGKIRAIYKGTSVSKIKHSFETLSDQLIVLYATYLENIIKDYFEKLFIHNPKLMNECFISKEKNNAKGFIKLNKILDSESKESFIISIANEAAITTSKGEIKSVLKRICKSSEQSIANTIIIGIESLFEKRNKIVHESHRFNLSYKQLEQYTKLIIEFIKQLAEMAKNNNVAVFG